MITKFNTVVPGNSGGNTLRNALLIGTAIGLGIYIYNKFIAPQLIKPQNKENG